MKTVSLKSLKPAFQVDKKSEDPDCQSKFTCLKSTIETLEKCVKYVNNKPPESRQ